MNVRTRRGFLTADALNDGYIEQRGWLSPSGHVANVVELRQNEGDTASYRVIHTIIRRSGIPEVVGDTTHTSLTEARRHLMEAGAR